MHFMTEAQLSRLREFEPYNEWSDVPYGWKIAFDDDAGRMRVALRATNESTFYDFQYERFVTTDGEIERWDDEHQCFFPTTPGPRWGYYKSGRDKPLRKYAY